MSDLGVIGAQAPSLKGAPLATGLSGKYLCELEAERRALADRFYRAQGYNVKCAANERVFVLCEAREEDGEEGRVQGIEQGALGEIKAAVRLVPQASGHYWLRNLVVAKDCRNQGLGSGLMRAFLPLLEQSGCYCFALTHLKQFYAQLGFELNPAHCPADILQRYQQYRGRGRDWLLMGVVNGVDSAA